jgi:hypothetical protein
VHGIPPAETMAWIWMWVRISWPQVCKVMITPGCFPLRPLRLCGETQEPGQRPYRFRLSM